MQHHAASIVELCGTCSSDLLNPITTVDVLEPCDSNLHHVTAMINICVPCKKPFP